MKTTCTNKEPISIKYRNFKNFSLLDFTNQVQNEFDIFLYKKQRNYVTKINKESKMLYFESLNPKKQPKPFWDKCKPYFSNKKTQSDSYLHQNLK